MDRPLLLVTGGELAVVDEPDLVARLATGRPFWRSAGLVVRADDGDRAWGQAQWRGLLISARLQFADEHATRKLLREPRVAQVLAPGSPPPDAPAVVVDGGVVVGAWLPRPAVRRGATESLQHAMPPSDAPGARTLRRTPHLDAPDELATAPGTTFTVAVFADTAARADAEAGSDLTLELPPGADELRVGVLLSVSEHFAVVGEPYATLTLRADAAVSAALPFTLSVTGAAPPGEAGIVALFTFQGRPCGSVRRAWSWDARLPRATPVVPPEGSAPPAVAVHPEAGRPDLTVLVTAPADDGQSFMCSVSSPLLPAYDQPTPAEPFRLPARADAFVATRLARLSDTTLEPADRRLELDAAGAEFWRAAPEVFKRVLGELLDAGSPPRAIFIVSAEPALPWELMIPSFPDADGIPIDRRPLGVEFSVGRWVHHGLTSPPPGLPITTSLVVAPTYEGERALDASAETELLKRRLGGERVVPATRDGIDARLATTTASLLHFVCHGAAGVADDDAIYLDDDKELRAGVVRVLPGFKAACRSRRPLVFLNACEAGKLVEGVGGTGGFPFVFTELGARAVVAPLWPYATSARAGSPATSTPPRSTSGRGPWPRSSATCAPAPTTRRRSTIRSRRTASSATR